MTAVAPRRIKAKSPVEIKIEVLTQRKEEAARIENQKDHTHGGVKKRKGTDLVLPEKKRSTKNQNIRRESVPMAKIKNPIMNQVLELMKIGMDEFMNLLFPLCF